MVDHGRASAWTDDEYQPRPLSSALIYELHVGTFTTEGTFEAAIGKLDHLKTLGVTHVEIMPVADFPGRFGWGYDGVNLFAPRHAYGGPEGLKKLVDACHGKKLGVILDVVYNHLGPSGNYLPKFAPYFTDRHHTPWGDALNFDGPYSDEVRRYFCDNALMWLRDYHIDGLRLDAVHAIVDTSATPFLEQLATEVDVLKAHLGRHLVLIAESDLNDPRIVRPCSRPSASASTPSGPTTSTTPCTRSSRARRTAITRTSARCATWPPPSRPPTSTPAAGRSSGAAATAGRRSA